MNGNFRVYTSPDIIGIELGGSIKNVIALAAGVCDGLGFGDNTKAALITRGIAEIERLGVAMGGSKETFGGLSGIGDLIVTCTSRHSRNHNAGYLIGKGKTMKEAMDEVNQVVEGVYSAKAAYCLAKKYNVSMPKSFLRMYLQLKRLKPCLPGTGVMNTLDLAGLSIKSMGIAYPIPGAWCFCRLSYYIYKGDMCYVHGKYQTSR